VEYSVHAWPVVETRRACTPAPAIGRGPGALWQGVRELNSGAASGLGARGASGRRAPRPPLRTRKPAAVGDSGGAGRAQACGAPDRHVASPPRQPLCQYDPWRVRGLNYLSGQGTSQQRPPVAPAVGWLGARGIAVTVPPCAAAPGGS
jgi:hypothetical protein